MKLVLGNDLDEPFVPSPTKRRSQDSKSYTTGVTGHRIMIAFAAHRHKQVAQSVERTTYLTPPPNFLFYLYIIIR